MSFALADQSQAIGDRDQFAAGFFNPVSRKAV